MARKVKSVSSTSVSVKVIEEEVPKEVKEEPHVEPNEGVENNEEPNEEPNEEWSPEEEENFLDLVKIYVQVLLKQHDKDVVKELVRENKQWKGFVEETLGLSNYKIRKIVKDNKDEPFDKIVEKVMYEGDDDKVEIQE